MSDDLVKRLRNTPNWMREGFQDWKDNVRTYDRTPFEAADRIEELEAKLAKTMEVVEMIASADVDAVLGEAVDLSCEIIGELMEEEEDA